MTAYFEDIAVGEELALGSHTFTADEIIAFARKYDPQPFHLSEEAAAKSQFGRLCASGWHTAAVFMRLSVDMAKALKEAALQRGDAIAEGGPSPGFENLKWLRPVYVGDTITYKRVISEKIESRSRPQWGIVRSENHGTNQNGEPVFFFKSAVFVERKPKPTE